MARRIPCVGAVIPDGDRLLVVRRARAPGAGLWTIPGGRVEAGETDHEALRREVREETGLDVTVGRLLGTVEQDAGEGAVFVIRDYMCAPEGGDLRPGDDAADARWVTAQELRRLPTTPHLVETLVGWQVLPPASLTPPGSGGPAEW